MALEYVVDDAKQVFANLKELTTYWTAEHGFDKVYAPEKQVWKDNALSTQKTVEFFNQWSVYLHDVYPFMQMLYVIPASFVKLLFFVSSSIEALFDKIFILFGLFNYLSDTTTWLGKFYFWGRFIGIAIFVTMLIARITLSFIGGSFKYKEFFNNLIIISFALNVLPTALIASGNIISHATTTLRTHSASKEPKEKQSLSLQPVKSNIVDLFYLIDEDFDVKKLEYNANTGYVQKDASLLNDISDRNLQYTKLEDFIGAPTEEMLNFYIYKDDDKKEKRTSSDDYYGVATLLTSIKKQGEKRNGRDHYVIAGVEISSMFGMDFSIFTPVYPRYKVDYLAIFIQQIMLIVLMVGLLISMLQTVFKVLLSSVVAPFVAYTSVEDSTKFMELLQSIFSGIAGIFFEIAILQFSLWFLKHAQTVAIGKATLLSNLGWFSKVVMIIILYIATYLGAMQGSSAIKSWLGVSTGAKSGVMTALGAGFGAYQGAKMGTNAVLGRKNYMTGKRHGGLVGASKKGFGAAGMAAKFGAKGAKRGFGMAGTGLGKLAGGYANLHSGAKAHMAASGVGYGEGMAKTMGERAIVGSHNAIGNAKKGIRNGKRKVVGGIKSNFNKVSAPVKKGYASTRNGLTKMKATPLGANKRKGNAYKVPKNVMNDYRKRLDVAKQPKESGAKPVNTIHYSKVQPPTQKNSLENIPTHTGEVEEF